MVYVSSRAFGRNVFLCQCYYFGALVQPHQARPWKLYGKSKEKWSQLICMISLKRTRYCGFNLWPPSRSKSDLLQLMSHSTSITICAWCGLCISSKRKKLPTPVEQPPGSNSHLSPLLDLQVVTKINVRPSQPKSSIITDIFYLVDLLLEHLR